MGGAFVGSRREKACSCVNRENGDLRFRSSWQFGKLQAERRRPRVFWKRTNEGGTVWNLPVQKRQLALRGCLHMESTIDSYGVVIDRFGRRLAAEPLTVLNHFMAGHVVDPPAEPGPSTWALSEEQARPGFVC